MSSGDYTTEQLKQISDLYANEIKEKRLRIVEIDKKFKKNNEKIVINAVENVLGISVIIGVLLSSEKSIQDFGSNQISSLIEEMNNFLVPIMDTVDPIDLMSTMYLKLMEVLEQLIDRFGVVGIGLASKALTFITRTIIKGKKSRQLKEEKEVLEQKIKEYEDLDKGKGR